MTLRAAIRLIGLIGCVFLSLTVADARAQLSRVSVATDGAQANAGSDAADISADGRFVAFSSTASNLVANDTNNSIDIFVRDRTLNTTTRVSVTSGGEQRNGLSTAPEISANGRFVVFLSTAPLIAEDTQVCQPAPAAAACQDVYVHDRDTGVTTRVSVSSQGTQAEGDSFEPHISGDGRLVVFESLASNLVAGDTNGVRDAFLHDRQTGTTIRLVGAGSLPQREGEPEPRISADGSLIAFTGFVSPSTLPQTAPGTPPLCHLGDACPATFVYSTATGTSSILSTALLAVQTQNVLFADEPNFISVDGRVIVIKQVMLVANANPLQAQARFIVYDRTTGGMTVGPWQVVGGTPLDVVVGLSGDGRYEARLSYVIKGFVSRLFRDRLSAFEDGGGRRSDQRSGRDGAVGGRALFGLRHEPAADRQ